MSLVARGRRRLDLAGEDRNGKKVLTRVRLERFYNGSLVQIHASASDGHAT